MKNTYLNKFDSIIKIKVTGKNIDNYIRRLIKKKINIIKLIPISYKEAHIIIKYIDYKKITKYKTIYKIEIINNYGLLKLKSKVKKNSFLLTLLLLSISVIITLSNIIFNIQIIHSDKKIRTLIKEELSNYGIKKYTFKKKYNELESIEDKILNNNKDKLEWIEIEEYGTKYIVRAEERKLNNKESSFKYQSIISKKNAVIKKIYATSGEIIKNIDDYVKKGDTIISGYITHPDNTKTPTMAKGIVYGEVWYTIKVDYPYVYQEEKLTGKNKTVYVINFFNKRLSIFNFDKYKSFKTKNTILLKNIYNTINLTKEKQYELNIIDDVYTEEEVLDKAIDYSKEKLLKENINIKDITKVTILSKDFNEKNISLKLFIKAIENIEDIQEINPNQFNDKVLQ